MRSQRSQDSRRGALLGYLGGVALGVIGVVAVVVVARIVTDDGLGNGYFLIGEALSALAAFLLVARFTALPRSREGRSTAPYSQSADTETPALPGSSAAAGALIGRAKLVAEIERILDNEVRSDRAPIVNIYGPPGIGKTTVAKMLAHRASRHVLLARLEPSEKAERITSGSSRILADLLDQMDAPAQSARSPISPAGPTSPMSPAGPASNDTSGALSGYRHRLGSGNYLLILDDVSVLDQVRDLLPSHPPSCAVLVTRNRLGDAIITESFPVENLDDCDALTLLGQVADFDRVKREREGAEQIVRLCGNMPLALSIAGARLALRPNWPLATFAERLLEQRTRLDELQLGDVGVRESLSLSYHDLSTGEQLAFRRLGMLDQVAVASWVVAPLLGDIGYIEADQIARRLAAANLLQEIWSSDRLDLRYGMHELVRCYAQEVLIDDSEADRVNAIKRLADAYTALAYYVADQPAAEQSARRGRFAAAPPSALTPEDLHHLAGAAPLRFLVAESRAMVATVERASEHGLSELCWQVAVATLPFFEVMRGAWGSWEPPPEFPVSAGSAEDATWERAMMHLVRGTHATGVDRYDVADEHYQHALDLFLAIGDDAGYAQTCRHRGEALRVRGQYGEATIWLQEAHDCSERIGDRLGQARAWLDLGNCHRVAHLDNRALWELERALEVFTEKKDRFEQARALRALGVLQQQRHQLTLSEKHLVEALRIFESFEAYKGDSYWAACTRYSLAKLRLDQKRPQAAAEMLETALAAFEGQSGSRLWQARIHRQFARVRLAEGRLREAKQHAMTSYELCAELELVFRMAHAKRTLAAVLIAEGDLEAAERLLTEAKETYEEKVWNPWYAAEAAWKLALAYSERHREKAIPLLREAVSGFGKIDDTTRQREVFDRLSLLSRSGTVPVVRRLGLPVKRSA